MLGDPGRRSSPGTKRSGWRHSWQHQATRSGSPRWWWGHLRPPGNCWNGERLTALEACAVRGLWAPRPDSGPEARWALERGLLVQDRHGYGPARMPAEVALALRGDDWHAPFLPAPPEVRTTPITRADVDREAAATATAFAAHAAAVLTVCSAAPPARLKSGGVGARELSRVAKAARRRPTSSYASSWKRRTPPGCWPRTVLRSWRRTATTAGRGENRRSSSPCCSRRGGRCRRPRPRLATRTARRCPHSPEHHPAEGCAQARDGLLTAAAPPGGPGGEERRGTGRRSPGIARSPINSRRTPSRSRRWSAKPNCSDSSPAALCPASAPPYKATTRKPWPRLVSTCCRPPPGPPASAPTSRPSSPAHRPPISPRCWTPSRTGKPEARRQCGGSARAASAAPWTPAAHPT